jgi:hypothetical protein
MRYSCGRILENQLCESLLVESSCCSMFSTAALSFHTDSDRRIARRWTDCLGLYSNLRMADATTWRGAPYDPVPDAPVEAGILDRENAARNSTFYK